MRPKLLGALASLCLPALTALAAPPPALAQAAN
jgi:hypothetical protein